MLERRMPDRIPETPLVRCVPLETSPPSLQENTADADRLKKALAGQFRQQEQELCIPFRSLSVVAGSFRAAGFRGAAVLNMLPTGTEIVDFLPVAPDVLPGLAIDLGTTHLEASLLDLFTGRLLAAGHIENRQTAFGGDILTRIHYARQGGPPAAQESSVSGLVQLQESVVASINQLAAGLADQAGITATDIRAMTVSGNTTMVHLLLGLSPYHICREPYIPLVNSPDPLHAHELDLAIAPLAPVLIMPSIGSYFGGDLISGILATGLDEAAETAMLIDVGTNAEVVLGNRDWLIACAGAAGPALEGGVARMGMKAGPGAVEHVRIDRSRWQLAWETVDNAPALGICGSGLIDLVAELYLARVIDFRGKFNPSVAEESTEHGDFLRRLLIRSKEGWEFIVVPADAAANGNAVMLAQTDLDAIMRSKAAMYAILTTLVSQVGIDFSELDRIYVAGAFGKHIDPQHAITLGMLPDLPLSTYVPVGNSSLRGAEKILLSEPCRQRSAAIHRKITYLELNVNQEFMIRFSGSRFIPHTDPSLFPSVPIFRADPV